MVVDTLQDFALQVHDELLGYSEHGISNAAAIKLMVSKKIYYCAVHSAIFIA